MTASKPNIDDDGERTNDANGASTAAARDDRRCSPSRIGGPGSRLPTCVESFLAWSLCISCLGVSGYHFVVATFLSPAWAYLRLSWRRIQSQTIDDGPLPYERCWVPLTTHSRAELDRAGPRERHDQLVKVLGTLLGEGEDSDDALVLTIRSNEVCRRLASLAMRPSESTTATLLREAPELKLVQRLARLWPTLLALPPPKEVVATQDEQSTAGHNKYDISLILPAFRENGKDIDRKLSRARESCINPSRVEVILVDAGGCQNLDLVLESQKRQSDKGATLPLWGRVNKINFTSGGGRGPCLNEGANEANGRILTFCHSDTQLPNRWDVSLIKAFGTPIGEDVRMRSNSAAFSFGIDTSPSGLIGSPYPPGIKAVESTANLRTHLYSLPYGDQCISVPADVFRFLGGFPDQCLMEDYELVALLRKRAALIDRFGIADREQVTIVGGGPALCSPRRWQKFGVLYVTYMNSRFVNLYTGGMGPDDLFRLYYGACPPKRDCELSPWEIEMADLLLQKTTQ